LIERRQRAQRAKLLACTSRTRAIEPSAGVNFAQLLCVIVATASSRSPVRRQTCIVNDNGHAIARQAHVEFYSVGTQLHRQRERSERVFQERRRKRRDAR